MGFVRFQHRSSVQVMNFPKSGTTKDGISRGCNIPSLSRGPRDRSRLAREYHRPVSAQRCGLCAGWTLHASRRPAGQGQARRGDYPMPLARLEVRSDNRKQLSDLPIHAQTLLRPRTGWENWDWLRRLILSSIGPESGGFPAFRNGFRQSKRSGGPQCKRSKQQSL